MAAPFVAIRTDVRKDERFSVLGDVCGYSRHEAVGRMFDLWAWCTDRRLEDAPDDCRGYAVSEPVARRFLGPRAVAGLLGDGCDEFALAELRPDGLLYLRGTEESVSRQRGHRVTAVAGGEARVATSSRSAGKFVRHVTNDQPSTSCEPAAPPAVYQPEPATYHKPQITDHRPPKSACAPDARAPVTYDPATPGAKYKLASQVYGEVSALRLTVAAELGIPGQLPFPILTPAARPLGIRDLIERVTEEGDAAPLVCARVVEALADRARASKSIEWLSPKAFTTGGWRTAREHVPGRRNTGWDAAARSPHVGRVEPERPESYGLGDQKL